MSLRSPSLTVALPASASGQVGPQSTNQRLAYVGFTVYAAAAAVIRVRANGAITGDIIDTIAFAAGESVGDEYNFPRQAGSGVYVELVSGTMPEGSVFVQ